MAEALYLRCPNGHEFRSPIQLSRAALDNPESDISDNEVSCPACDVPVLMATATLFFKDG